MMKQNLEHCLEHLSRFEPAPSYAAYDALNAWLFYPIHRCNIGLVDSAFRVQGSYLNNIMGSKFRAPARFGMHIPHVVAHTAKEKMPWIDACRVVAFMKNMVSAIYRSIGDPPHDASGSLYPLFISEDFPVSFPVFPAHPIPAFISSALNEMSKYAFGCGRSYYCHEGSFTNTKYACGEGVCL